MALRQRLIEIDKKELEALLEQTSHQNPWFTPENIKLSISGLINYLDEKKLNSWLKNYPYAKNSIAKPNKVGIIMAGNIPMVGIHDLICVLLSGHHAVIKLSSQDDVLIRFIISELKSIEPEYEDLIEITDRLKGIDAVIATGSNNSSRYFDYYFSKYPHIIRKNRTSVAVLNGKESPEDLAALGEDIFSYFGLGCRNVSKLFLPEGYDIKTLIPHFENYDHLLNHNKYANNYFYNRSIFLVNQTVHLDSGFALFQQNENLSSPISVIYYDFYKDINDLNTQLSLMNERIQCFVSKDPAIAKSINFGKAQKPEIWDYADYVDTMQFLSEI